MVTVVRYLFIVLNTFHIILGLLLATFGFWLQYASPIREVLNADYTSLTVVYFTISLGFILLLFVATANLVNKIPFGWSKTKKTQTISALHSLVVCRSMAEARRGHPSNVCSKCLDNNTAYEKVLLKRTADSASDLAVSVTGVDPGCPKMQPHIAITAIGQCAIGAFGNMVSNKKVLGVYLGLNVAIVILEIAAIGYGYSQRNTQQTLVQSVWTSMPVIDQYIIQARFNCCGYTGPEEYNNVYPDSCLQNVSNPNSYWPVGCSSSLSLWFDQNVTLLAILIGLLLVASVIQCILSAKLLWNAVRHPNSVAADELEAESDDEDEKILRSRPSSRISKRSYQHMT